MPQGLSRKSTCQDGTVKFMPESKFGTLTLCTLPELTPWSLNCWDLTLRRFFHISPDHRVFLPIGQAICGVWNPKSFSFALWLQVTFFWEIPQRCRHYWFASWCKSFVFRWFGQRWCSWLKAIGCIAFVCFLSTLLSSRAKLIGKEWYFWRSLAFWRKWGRYHLHMWGCAKLIGYWEILHYIMRTFEYLHESFSKSSSLVIVVNSKEYKLC